MGRRRNKKKSKGGWHHMKANPQLAEVVENIQNGTTDALKPIDLREFYKKQPVPKKLTLIEKFFKLLGVDYDV